MRVRAGSLGKTYQHQLSEQSFHEPRILVQVPEMRTGSLGKTNLHQQSEQSFHEPRILVQVPEMRTGSLGKTYQHQQNEQSFHKELDPRSGIRNEGRISRQDLPTSTKYRIIPQRAGSSLRFQK